MRRIFGNNGQASLLVNGGDVENGHWEVSWLNEEHTRGRCEHGKPPWHEFEYICDVPADLMQEQNYNVVLEEVRDRLANGSIKAAIDVKAKCWANMAADLKANPDPEGDKAFLDRIDKIVSDGMGMPENLLEADLGAIELKTLAAAALPYDENSCVICHEGPPCQHLTPPKIDTTVLWTDRDKFHESCNQILAAATAVPDPRLGSGCPTRSRQTGSVGYPKPSKCAIS